MKHFFSFTSLALMLICLSSFNYGQTTAYLKVADHGSFKKIEKISNGGYITVGNDSAYNFQIIKYDAGFTPVWKTTFTDATISPVAPQIIEGNDGSFYFMTGSDENTGSTFIVKLSSTGSIVWQKKYYLSSGSLLSQSLSKASGSNNGFIFGGGQCTLTNFLIKCDADGNIEWQYQYIYPLSTGVAVCWSIIPDGNNYIVSSGYNINSLLTMKISSTGTVLAHTAYTYTGMYILPTRIVKLKQTGGYAIVGNYNSTNDNKTEFVAILDQNLSLLTFNEITVTYTQFTLSDIVAVNNGRNVAVVGSIYDNSAFTTATLLLSNGGNIIWKKRSAGNTGGITNVSFEGITLNENSIVIGGYGYNDGSVIAILDTNGNGLCNDVAFSATNVHRTLSLQSSTIAPAASSAAVATVSYTFNNAASYNKYIYCGSLSSIETHDDNVFELNVFPNPAKDIIHIECSSNTNSREQHLNIYNLQGQLVYSKDLLNHERVIEIETSGFADGIHLIRISNDSGLSESAKILISH